MELYLENKVNAHHIWVRDQIENISDARDRWRDLYYKKDAEFENYKNNVERSQAEKCKRCKECKMLTQ